MAFNLEASENPLCQVRTTFVIPKSRLFDLGRISVRETTVAFGALDIPEMASSHILAALD
jgi:hypothetical protein